MDRRAVPVPTRTTLAVVALSVLSAGLFATAVPSGAAVTAVRGSACGYYVNVGLFGGPRDLRGCGQAPDAPASAASPSASLPPAGSATAISAGDADGATAKYGPAVIFGGIWPDSSPTGPPSGPLTATTEGTPGPNGSVTSSASVVLNDPPDPDAPGGAGPGPVTADEVHSTCTADDDGVRGSASFVNAILTTSTNPDGGAATTEAVPDNPPPNYTRDATINNVGGHPRIVYNEQVLGPDGSLTVNAVHMYLLGPVALGDMVIAQSVCGVASTVANAAPVAGDDTFATDEDTALTVPAPGLVANDTDADGDALSAINAKPVFVPGPNNPAETTGNTYTFPSDPANGSVTIDTDGSFTYVPDANFNGTDTFTYVVRDPRGAHDKGTVTVTVNASEHTVSAGHASVSEGDVGGRAAVVTVSLSSPSTSTVTVDYATHDGTAVAPGDYATTSGTLSFPPGATSLTVKVPVVADTLAEDDESFTLDLAPASGAVVGDGAGGGTIIDDDPATSAGRRLAIGDVAVHEGDAGVRTAVFTVSLSKPSTGSVTVYYTTANGSASKIVDYTRRTGKVAFPPGVTSMPVKVPVTADTDVEGDETFTVQLSLAGGATIIDAVGTGIIVDDDGP